MSTTALSTALFATASGDRVPPPHSARYCTAAVCRNGQFVRKMPSPLLETYLTDQGVN